MDDLEVRYPYFRKPPYMSFWSFSPLKIWNDWTFRYIWDIPHPHVQSFSDQVYHDISYHDVALWKCILEDTPILRPTKVWIKFTSLRAWPAPRLCLGKFLLGDFQGIGHRLEMIIRIWVGHLSAAVLEMAPLIFFCGCCLVLIAMFFGNPVGKNDINWYQLEFLWSSHVAVMFGSYCLP